MGADRCNVQDVSKKLWDIDISTVDGRGVWVQEPWEGSEPTVTNESVQSVRSFECSSPGCPSVTSQYSDLTGTPSSGNHKRSTSLWCCGEIASLVVSGALKLLGGLAPAPKGFGKHVVVLGSRTTLSSCASHEPARTQCARIDEHMPSFEPVREVAPRTDGCAAKTVAVLKLFIPGPKGVYKHGGRTNMKPRQQR